LNNNTRLIDRTYLLLPTFALGVSASDIRLDRKSSSVAAVRPPEVVLAADEGLLNLEVVDGPGLLAFIVPPPVLDADAPPEPVRAAGARELDNLEGGGK